MPLFNEFQKYYDDALANVEKAKAKYDATAAQYEVEKAAKEARERDEAAKLALADFETRSNDRKTEFTGLDATFTAAKAALDANLTAIENLKGQLNSDPTNAAAAQWQSDLDDAEAATEGLRDAKTTAEEARAPVLLAQGLDSYYIKSGLEFTAYENFKAANDNLEGATEALNDVAAIEFALEEELETAVYEIGRANNQKEYEKAERILEDVQTRYDAMMEKKNIAQAAFDTLSVDVPNLKQAYDDAKQAREDEKQFIKDNAGIEVDEFDPTEGPPTLPPVPDAAAGSGDSSGSSGSGSGSGSTDGSSGSGSGGSGSGGSGGSSV